MTTALKKTTVTRSIEFASWYETVDPDLMILKRDEKYQDPNVIAGSVVFEIEERTEAYDPNTYYDLCMKWQEWETDEELEKRRQQMATFKAQRDAFDRAEFERLSKQFGGK